MKKKHFLVTVLIAIIFSAPSFAQGKFGKDSAECIKYLSFYRDYAKKGDYKEAYPLWKEAYRLCPPQSSQNLLYDGQKIMRSRINLEKDKSRRKMMVDSLMVLHGLRIEFYPRFKRQSLSAKAIDMSRYDKKVDPLETLETLEASIEASLSTSLTSTGLLVLYMNLAKTLYEEGKIDEERVLNVYEIASECGKTIYARKPSDALNEALTNVDNFFATSGVANCDNLIRVFAPKYKADSLNKDLVSTIFRLLSETQCADSDLFIQTLGSLHRMEPSHTTAFYLYRLYSNRGEHDKAIEFLVEAIDHHTSDEQKDGEYNLELATYYLKYMKDYVKAVEIAKKVPTLNPDLAGRAYFLIGTVWISIKCEGNDIERRAQYWVAVDYFIKARRDDSTLEEEANKMITTNRQYFPLKSEAFMYDIHDKAPYTISCSGLRETTIVRTRNN